MMPQGFVYLDAGAPSPSMKIIKPSAIVLGAFVHRGGGQKR